MRAHFRVPREGGALHVAKAGVAAPAIVLLHGWPQTHREWGHIVDRLEEEFTILTPDLRGCGDSFKPFTGYDAETLAGDVAAVLDFFDIDRVHIVGHDIGGPIAYAFSAVHRDRALSLTLLEAPLWGVVSETAPDLTTLFWHLQFHQEVDLAAALIGADIEAYLDHYYRDFAFDPTAVGPADRAEYLRAYSGVGALRGSLMHYAAIPQLAEALPGLGRDKLTIPVSAYGGETVMNEYCRNAALLVAQDVEGGVIRQCGHWAPEEQPDIVADIIRATIERVRT